MLDRRLERIRNRGMSEVLERETRSGIADMVKHDPPGSHITDGDFLTGIRTAAVLDSVQQDLAESSRDVLLLGRGKADAQLA